MYPRQRHGNHRTGCWVGLETCLDGKEKLATPGFDPKTVRLVASRYMCHVSIVCMKEVAFV